MDFLCGLMRKILDSFIHSVQVKKLKINKANCENE